MNAFTTLPRADRAIVRRPHRLIALSRLLDAVRDDELERTIEMLIAVRDARDSDPDVEPNGDELDGSTAEDDYGATDDASGMPGCAISDPGGGDANDEAADLPWTEWQTRGQRKVDDHGAEIVGRDRYGNLLHEDREDDDADESAEDDPRGFDPESDMGAEEGGEPAAWIERDEGRQPDIMSNTLREEDEEPDCAILRCAQRDRIRRTRCKPVYTGRYHTSWRLERPASPWVRA